MFRKLSLTLGGALIGVMSLFGQPPVDSLNALLKTRDHSIVEYRSILNLLAKRYAEQNPDTALIIANRSLELSEIDDPLKGQGYVAISTAYSYLAQYDSSTAYSFKALAIAEKFSDTVTMIDALNNLGIDYMFQEQYRRSVNYFQQVEHLSQLIGDTLRWGHALNNIGMIEGFEGELEGELRHYDQAAYLFLAIGEQEGFANTLLNAGTTYTELEQFKEADSLYGQALEIFKTIGFSSGVQQTLQSTADSKLRQGDYQQATDLINEALAIIYEYDYLQDEIYSYELLTQIAEAQDDFREALRYQRLVADKKAEVFDMERINQIDELQTRYETEKKEQQLILNKLQLRQNRNEKLALIGVILVILLGGAYVFYSMHKRARLERQLLAEEVDNLRLKINALLGTGEGVKLTIEDINSKLVQPLSDREFDILELTVSDKSNPQIAETLVVSVNTVKFHLKNIYEKLGVSNRKEAISFVIGKN